MIKNFFQSLERNEVDYLLISGQATVLYGAATFSEDIDLWVNPAEENRRRFIQTLTELQALYYKLTPPFTPEFLNRGHGFHFILPADFETETYLDVMGRPPRVKSFSLAVESAKWIDTEWGSVHTIGIQNLVEIKKTQRLGDYAIISRLALTWLDQPECQKQTGDFAWATENIFTLETLEALFQEHPNTIQFIESSQASELVKFGKSILADESPEALIEETITKQMQLRMSELQQADRQYWKAIIAELRQLRRTGKLMEEGAPVEGA